MTKIPPSEKLRKQIRAFIQDMVRRFRRFNPVYLQASFSQTLPGYASLPLVL